MESDRCPPGGSPPSMAKKRKLSELPGVLSCTSIENSPGGAIGGPCTSSSIGNNKSAMPSPSTSETTVTTTTTATTTTMTTNAVTSLSAGAAAARAVTSTGAAAAAAVGAGGVPSSNASDSGSSALTSCSNPPLQASIKTESMCHPSSSASASSSASSGTGSCASVAAICATKAKFEKKPTPPPPLKATTMSHLRTKYMSQLEYMHREFKKLERQLLGARTRNGKETTGSRERREKLHSFILHLEDTMEQIERGCKLELEGKSTLSVAFSSMGGTANGVSSGANKNNGRTNPSGESINADVRNQLNEEEEEAKEQFARSSALTKLTKEKEEEENVQRLEEHILANLLPVKDRLTRQLAAQQGAARNPAGMPISRRGLPASVADRGKGTFAAAAEQRRLAQMQQQQDRHGQDAGHMPLNPDSAGPISGPVAQSQFGKPLGGGSSLTQKLHGTTLGSHQRASGYGVGSDNINRTVEKVSPTPERKVMYAGMTPGSRQVKSGVSAAAGVHDIKIQNPRLKDVKKTNDKPIEKNGPVAPPPPPQLPVSNATTQQANVPTTLRHSVVSKQTKITPKQTSNVMANMKKGSTVTTNAVVKNTAPPSRPLTISNKTLKPTVPPPPPEYEITVVPKSSKSWKDPTLTEEQRREIRERRRQRKMEKRRAEARQRQMIIQQQQQQQKQQQQQVSNVRRGTKTSGIARSVPSQRKGPRTVEYICGLCNETYKSTCDCNPWWALTSHECMKCGKVQVPRLDISAPDNVIEYHPALLAHAADDSSKSSNKSVTTSSLARINIKNYISTHSSLKDNTLQGLGNNDDDLYTSDSDDSEICDDMSPAAQAENEDFGSDYSGPKFNDYDASRLLIMFAHASTCPGRHKDPKTNAVCLSMKYMMLHVRDCPGTTSTYDICPYPWCRKTKHLLYHLVSCDAPERCKICTPEHLTPQLRQLQGLNEFRRKKQRESGKALSMTNSLANKPSAKMSNPNNSKIQANGGVVNGQQTKVSPHNANALKGKRNQGPNPIMSAQKLQQVNKRKPLSVPSPIPSVVPHQPNSSKTTGATLPKRRHPGSPTNVSTKSIATSSISRVQPNRNALSIAAPANPLLPTQGQLTPRTQNSTISTIPISRQPQPANPLLKQLEVNNLSTKDPIAINETPSVEVQSNMRVSKANNMGVLSQNNQTMLGPNINPPKASISSITIPKQEGKEKPFVTPVTTNALSTESVHSQTMTTSKETSYVSNSGMQRTKSETILKVGC